MSNEAINKVLSQDNINGAEKFVKILLANRVNQERADMLAWPSLSTLAKETGYSRRYIIRVLDKLEKMGEIFRIRNAEKNPATRGLQKGATSTIYRLLFPASDLETTALVVNRPLPSDLETTALVVNRPLPSDLETTALVVNRPPKPKLNPNESKGEPKKDPPTDGFSLLQDSLESFGIVLKGPDMTLLSGWFTAGVIPADIEDALRWRREKNLPPVKSASQLEGGVDTARRKRLQTVPGKSNGNGHKKFDAFTEAELAKNDSVKSAFSYLRNNPHGGGREESLERLAEFGIGFERYGEDVYDVRLVALEAEAQIA